MIELMIVVAVITVLFGIGTPYYISLIKRANAGETRGNLGSLRSALSIYYADMEAHYPSDDLSCLFIHAKYMNQPPTIMIPDQHVLNTYVIAETTPTDNGRWSYNNDSTSVTWGRVHAGCTHPNDNDSGLIWSAY